MRGRGSQDAEALLKAELEDLAAVFILSVASFDDDFLALCFVIRSEPTRCLEIPNGVPQEWESNDMAGVVEQLESQPCSCSHNRLLGSGSFCIFLLVPEEMYRVELHRKI